MPTMTQPSLVVSPWRDETFDSMFDHETCFLAACDNGAVKRCAKCGHARYCSKECQVADWKSHKRVCQRPTAKSICVGTIPATWLTGTPTGNHSTRQSARLVYDETELGKTVADPHIWSVANTPGVVGYLGHHHPESDGTFAICLADGDGTFISWVSSPPSMM
jgi:MYND finger